MSMRAAMLTGDFGFRQNAFLDALLQDSSGIEVRTLARPASPRGVPQPGPRPDRPREGGSVLRRLLARLPLTPAVLLAAYRPNLVITPDSGAGMLQAALYRSLSPGSRLLFCATEPPRRYGLVERVALRQADGVLADGEAAARAVELLRYPTSRIFPLTAPRDLEPFLACPATRAGAAAHRFVFTDSLSPQTGAADFLVTLAAWAERHPDRPVEVWWANDGDLAGVLEAQPLPDNLGQRFLGQPTRDGLAEAFAQCGILVAPLLGQHRLPLLTEALASGLPVLRRRAGKSGHLLRDGVTGWAFDPLRPDGLMRALDRAFDSSAEEIDRMRDAGRAIVAQAASQGASERIRGAVAAVFSGAAASRRRGAEAR